jgi:hypothetical protein
MPTSRALSVRRALPALLAVVPALILAGCGEPEAAELPPDADAMEAEVERDGAEVPAFSTEVRTAFRPPEGKDTGVLGTLRLLVPTEAAPEDAALRLRVELTGLPPGEHGWHIYEGPCGVEGGGLAVPVSSAPGREALAPPLRPRDDGSAEAEVAVPPLRDLWVDAGHYSVRVFEGAGVEAGPLLACALL